MLSQAYRGIVVLFHSSTWCHLAKQHIPAIFVAGSLRNPRCIAIGIAWVTQVPPAVFAVSQIAPILTKPPVSASNQRARAGQTPEQCVVDEQSPRCWRQFAFALITVSLTVVVCLGSAEILLRFLPVQSGLRTMPVSSDNPVFHFPPERDVTFEVIDLDADFFTHYAEHAPRFEYPRDGHWNETGHAVAAKAVLASKLVGGLTGQQLGQ